MSDSVPILTIDGPSGSGKGATSSLIAQTLQWNLLDSGSIYRAIAWLMNKQKDYQHYLSNETELSNFVQSNCADFTFHHSHVYHQQHDITPYIRTDKISLLTSRISQIASIRQSILKLQRNFAQPPGLVADGRDMGSVVFPHAQFKIFLTADVNIRAQRRYQQLINNDQNVNYEEVLDALKKRDKQDKEREFAPLKIPENAIVVDNSKRTLDETVKYIIQIIQS